MDMLRRLLSRGGRTTRSGLISGTALVAALVSFSLSGAAPASAQSLTHSMLKGLEAGGTESVALSPASAVIALGLTAEGAPEAIRKDLPSELKSDAWTFPIANAETANAVWVDDDSELKDGFRDSAAENWQADAQTVDFAGDAKDRVNAWAKEKTKGKIEKLLSELPDDVSVVLTNTIYFKAPWAAPFDPESTETGAFTKSDGSKVDAHFMVSHGTVKSGNYSAMQVFALPFGAEGQPDGTTMYILLPPKFTDVTGLDPFTDLAALEAAVTDDVHIKLPRFNAEGGGDMTATLASSAYNPLFQTKLVEMADDEPMISMVVQKCVVKIDEAGAEAAAATAVAVTRTSLQKDHPVIEIDRPFYFVITDGTSPVPLFAGYVAEPETAG